MTEADDPFADLESSVEDSEQQDSGESTDDVGQAAENTPDTQQTPSNQQGNQSEVASRSVEKGGRETTAGTSDPLNRRAFEFDQAKQSAIYARRSTWDEFDTTMTEIELAAKQQGAKEVTKSEIHDAILRTIDPEEIAEYVVKARRESSR